MVVSVKNKKVLFVDDTPTVCEGLSKLIELPNVECLCAYTVAEALAICGNSHIDVAMVDARMPPESGIALISQLHKKHPALKIVGITSFEEVATVLDFIEVKVAGIFLKNSGRKSGLNECLQAVLNGETYFPAKVKALLENHTQANTSKPITQFTPREQEILSLMSIGMKTKEIADQLKITKSTAEDHRERLMQKTGTDNGPDLIRFILKNGLL